MNETDPATGYLLAAKNTGSTESKKPSIVAGLIVSLVVISSVTFIRLGLRSSMSAMKTGVDDWAAVACSSNVINGKAVFSLPERPN